jgi:hypothetical protein
VAFEYVAVFLLKKIASGLVFVFLGVPTERATKIICVALSLEYQEFGGNEGYVF